jgi:hypothetical protein
VTPRRVAPLAAALALALAAACNKGPGPTTTRQDATPLPLPPPEPPSETTPMTTAPRPGLRKVLTPHPDTLAKQVTDETRAKAKAYLAAHPDLPPELRRGIAANEVWLGMTAEEVRLAIGEPTGTEPVPGKAGHQALLYRGEGWVFRFDDRGFLYEYVER